MAIDSNNDPPCLFVEVQEDSPEIATTREWRAKMVEARTTHGGEGLTQAELAKRVGTSQNMISLIESGQVESSQFVMPISHVLKIAPPMHFDDDLMREWYETGYRLAYKSKKRLAAVLAFVENMTDSDDDNET